MLLTEALPIDMTRTSPLPLMDKILKGEFDVPEEEDILNRNPASQAGANSIWIGPGRLERFALLSIFIQRVMEETLKEKDIVKFEIKGVKNPYFQLGDFIRDVTHRGIERDMQNLELLSTTEPTHPHVKALARNNRWEEFAIKNNLPKDRILERRLEDGVDTYFFVAPTVFEAIPRLYQRDFDKPGDPDELTDIADNSYIFVSQMAMAHLAIFRPIFWDWLRTTAFLDISKLLLKPYRSSHRVEFEEKQLVEEVDRICREDAEAIDLLSQMPLIGCPAMFSRGLKDLWDWNIADVKQIYQAQIAAN